MPLPALLGAALPYALTAGGSLLGGYLAGKGSSNQMTTGQPGTGQPGSQSSGNFLTGYNAQAQQLPRFNEQQQQALSQLLSQGMGQFNFPAIETAARSNFQSQTVPTLAERFASMGSGNRGSSGYGAALGRAGAGFEQQLAALKSQHGLGLTQLGLTPSFENIYMPQTGGLLGGAAPYAGAAAAMSAPYLIQQLIEWLKGSGGQQFDVAKKQGVA